MKYTQEQLQSFRLQDEAARARFAETIQEWKKDHEKTCEILEIQEPATPAEERSLNGTCDLLVQFLIILPLITDYDPVQDASALQALDQFIKGYIRILTLHQKSSPNDPTWQYEMNILDAINEYFQQEAVQA